LTLPNINEPNSRRRPLGQGYVGNVGSNKAAGFKSDFNATGNYSHSKTGVLDADLSITMNNGLGSGLISINKK
jgi:hypothetical protein